MFFIVVLSFMLMPCLSSGGVVHTLDQCQISCGGQGSLSGNGQSSIVSRLPQIPGKRGPMGPPGIPGPPGQCARCDNVEGRQSREELTMQMQMSVLEISQIRSELETLRNQWNEFTEQLPMSDCSHFQLRTTNGVALIDPYENPFKLTKALCLPGGWTVFQRRIDGSQDFFRGWDDYVNGFGDPNAEYWLGLETLHQITKRGNYQLKIELEDMEGNVGYGTYSTFVIGSKETNYTLTVGEYGGNIGDALTNNERPNEYHNGMMFSTKDRDNDRWTDNSCATKWHGAWWYNACFRPNLNGNYHPPKGNDWSGVVWEDWKGSKPLKSTKMMIKSKN